MEMGIASRPARPRVSFVMATHNRGLIVLECLRKTIACAGAALGHGHYECVVVDNASTDGTPDLIESLARELFGDRGQVSPDHASPTAIDGRCPLRVVRLDKNRGPVAKNVALEGNSADIIVLLDDDAYPLPGALAQMVRHFQDDTHLGAAVFDVTLPDGAKEASAFPDAFIGAGTALRGEALRTIPRSGKHGGILPWDFFMQAEEYDLSFRLLAAGWTLQRFWDMPLMHLKTPGARIGERTTRLDVRNNLWLLAKFVPAPLSFEFAAEWLARYWRMALLRDLEKTQNAKLETQNHPANSQLETPVAQSSALTPQRSAAHRAAFMLGAAEGMRGWAEHRGDGRLNLSAAVLERFFRFEAIHKRLERAKETMNLRRIALGDWGKNILPFWKACQALNIKIAAVLDGKLAGRGPIGSGGVSMENLSDYRGIPVIDEASFGKPSAHVDAIVITAMSPVHASRRAAELQRTMGVPVLDLFARGSIATGSQEFAFTPADDALDAPAAV